MDKINKIKNLAVVITFFVAFAIIFTIAIFQKDYSKILLNMYLMLPGLLYGVVPLMKKLVAN